MGYHYQMLVRGIRREPATRGCAGWPSLPNTRDSVVSHGMPGRSPQLSDAARAAPRRTEPTADGEASEPFEDRRNGAANLGIP